MNPSISELILNIDTWQGGRLQPHVDTARYTCASSNNREGPGVNSTTLFRFTNIQKRFRSDLYHSLQSSFSSEKYSNLSANSNSQRNFETKRFLLHSRGNPILNLNRSK